MFNPYNPYSNVEQLAGTTNKIAGWGLWYIRWQIAKRLVRLIVLTGILGGGGYYGWEHREDLLARLAEARQSVEDSKLADPNHPEFQRVFPKLHD